jgi:hypothetical protein
MFSVIAQILPKKEGDGRIPKTEYPNVNSFLAK